MSLKSRPFSDEYNKKHREQHGFAGIVFLVFAALMMAAGVFFDITSENIDTSKLFIIGFLFLVLSRGSYHRQSQFVENEAIYNAIQGRENGERIP